MYIAQKELSSLVDTVGLIQQSDCSQNSRQAITRQLMRLCGADYAASFAWDKHNHCFTDPAFENMDADNINRYLDYYQFHNPISHKLKKFRRAVSISEAISHKQLTKTEFYNDFLQKDGLTFGVNLFIYFGKEQRFDFRLWRSKKRNEFDQNKLMMLDSLIPSLQKMPVSSDCQPCRALYNFTQKEQQVIDLIRRGLPDKIMASCLDISITTLRTHIRKIYQKSDVHSRSELLFKL